MKKEEYTSAAIKIFKGLEAVRQRPGMYVGDITDGSGLHHLLFELLDNAVDEINVGNCSQISVVLYKDNSISVEDNGRGIPIDYVESEGKTALELVLTTLHAGAKFNNYVYSCSSGLHGVGLSVVNALSEFLEVIVRRNGFCFSQRYQYGVPTTDLVKIDTTNQQGTFIKILPDKRIFKAIKFIKASIIKRLHELAFLNNNIYLIFKDQKLNREEKFYQTGGFIEFLRHICSFNSIFEDQVFSLSQQVSFGYLDIVFCWITDLHAEKILCYTNNVFQSLGGIHLVSFKNSLTKTLLHLLCKLKFLKKLSTDVSSEDIKVGLCAVISLKMRNPRFSSQTKDKLISTDIKFELENVVSEFVKKQFVSKINFFKKFSEKLFFITKIRLSTKRAKEVLQNKTMFEFLDLPKTLTECNTRFPFEAEIFVVEGDSAGGSAKQARTRKNQAVLPIKGKILNVEKAPFDKILLNNEIKTLISALGCGFGKNEYNFKKLRYHTIIIMTDADVDGAHIRTLLLAFFYRYTPEFFVNGHIFVANPPLFSISINKKVYYFSTLFSVKKFIFWCFYHIYEIRCNFFNSFFYFQFLNSFPKKLIYYYFYLEEIFFSISYYLPFDLLFYILSYNETININLLSDKNKLLMYLGNLVEYLKKFENIFVVNKFGVDNLNNYWLPKFTICKKNIFFEIKFSLQFLFSDECFCLKKFIKQIMLLLNLEFVYVMDFMKVMNYTYTDILEKIFNYLSLFVSLQRYKGLGEMNPEQLWETTMNPQKRSLQLITIYNKEENMFIIDTLMGTNVRKRKFFIESTMTSFDF